jgi:flagellar hook-associated protein 1 FlgK
MAVGLTTALRTLVNSLDVSQQRLNYLSENVANVNTEGYTKKIVAQVTTVANGVALGVGVAEIRRAVDDFLTKGIRTQQSLLSESSTLNTYFDRIQKFSLGDPNSPYTINNTINDFFARIEDFSNDPSSAVKKSSVITSAKNFTDSLSNIANNIQQERFNADTEISTSIETLNSSLSNLHDLNSAIRQNSVAQGDVQKLLDARDVQVQKVKEQVGATVSFNEYGQVSIAINNNEILGYTQEYELEYTRVSSADTLINGGETAAIKVRAIDSTGQKTGNIETIVSASNDATQIDNITTGKIRALIDLRDAELPKILSQLDNIAFTISNEINEVHNNGSGFPPPETLTGVNEFNLEDQHYFTGKFRLTVTDQNGRPLDDRYGGKLTPLVIDLDEFDGGSGKGTASVDQIIREINNYYSEQPLTIVNIAAAKDIKIASVSDAIELNKASGSVTFSSNPALNDTIILNGVTYTFVDTSSANTNVKRGATVGETINNLVNVLNSSTNTSISAATYSAASSTLNIKFDKAGTSGNSYSLNVSGSTVASASGSTLSGGTDATGDFDFDFDLSNLSTDGKPIKFDVNSIALNSDAASTVTFTDTTIQAGQRIRTNLNGSTNGSLSVNLDALNLQEGDSFTIKASVKITDDDGTVHNEDVTFTVTIPDPDNEVLKNKRFTATAVGTGDGELVNAISNNPFLQATLVDGDGNQINTEGVAGVLKLKTNNSNYRVTIDQLDSKEVGTVGVANPADSASNRGLSHFFGLNNLFTFGNQKNNSALNISVREDIKTAPQLLSSGRAEKSTQTGANAVYTYEIGSGSNKAAIDLLRVQDKNLSFASAGSLPELFTTINSYATEIYNATAIQANSAESEFDKQTLLYNALKNKSDGISGVNIDEELAQTIEVQNAYSASAKVLSVVKELFDTLTSSLVG